MLRVPLDLVTEKGQTILERKLTSCFDRKKLPSWTATGEVWTATGDRQFGSDADSCNEFGACSVHIPKFPT